MQHATRNTPHSIRMPTLMGITQSGFDPASRFRFIQFIPYLEKHGWRVDHRPNRPDRQWHSRCPGRLPRALHYRAGRMAMWFHRYCDVRQMDAVDAVFVNRDLAGEGEELLYKPFAKSAGKMVYDFDDAIFVGPHEREVRWMCEHAGWVTPGNKYLADYARQFTDRVTVIPTVIDTDRYLARDYSHNGAGTACSRPSSANGLVRVGWSGSDQSIQSTLVPNLGMLCNLQKKVDFELVVITNTMPKLPTADLRWSFVPWNEREEHLISSQLDIGIMPLKDDAFQKGKCGLKLLQYMAAGLPTVASPVGVNEEIVVPERTGLLARNDSEWQEALAALIRSQEMRASYGRAGRQRCEEHYSIRRWLPVLLSLLNFVTQTKA